MSAQRDALLDLFQDWRERKLQLDEHIGTLAQELTFARKQQKDLNHQTQMLQMLQAWLSFLGPRGVHTLPVLAPIETLEYVRMLYPTILNEWPTRHINPNMNAVHRTNQILAAAVLRDDCLCFLALQVPGLRKKSGPFVLTEVKHCLFEIADLLFELVSSPSIVSNPSSAV